MHLSFSKQKFIKRNIEKDCCDLEKITFDDSMNFSSLAIAQLVISNLILFRFLLRKRRSEQSAHPRFIVSISSPGCIERIPEGHERKRIIMITV